MSVAPRRIERPPTGTDPEIVIAAVRDSLSRLRFGVIALTVHDGRVVQMETTEKRRFDA